MRVLGRWGIKVFWREEMVRSELRSVGLGAVCRKHEERKRGLCVHYSKWGHWLRARVARAEMDCSPGAS